MPGRVIAAFLLFLIPTQIEAQCNWTARSSSQFRASVLDVAGDLNDLWIATGYGVQLLDRTVDPPAPIASVALPDTTRVVLPRGGGSDIVYAGSGSRLYVLRKAGRTIQVVRSVDAGGTVNDIVFATYLFVATSNGLAHFDPGDLTNPTRTTVTLATSSPNVTSLSVSGSTLYAADGDATVETFAINTPSSPQRIGALESLPRSISVHAIGARVYVSDGQNTDIFLNGTRVARTPFGSTSFASITTDEHFVAGSERAIHAVDFSVGGSPVELYEQPLAPTPGTTNRVSAMHLSGNRLYVAAGDIGLAPFDVSGFTRPYPVRSLASGPTSSALVSGTTAFVTPAAGGISEYATSGNFLSFSRTQNAERQFTLHPDSAFLATSGAMLMAQGLNVTLPKPIVSAFDSGTLAYAVLEDNTLWSAGRETDSATPRQVSIGAIRPALVSGAGAAIALTEVTAAGNTNIHYYADGNFTKPPRIFPILGAPIGNVALSGTHAAVFTYQGVSLVELASGNVSVLPDSGAVLAKQFVFAGSRLLELTDRSLLVWDVATRRLAREILLPADAIAIDANETLAVIATVDGVTSVSFDAAQRLPQPLPIRNSNRYYTKLAAGDDRLYAFGENGVDIYSTSIGYTPLFVTGLRVGGMVDLAASGDHLFTLSSNAAVTTYGPDGNQIAQTTLSQEAETRPLNIVSVGGAPWVSFATNCAAGICREKKTYVLDPLTLAITATLTGGVVDAVTNGARGYALFDIPSEVRVYNIADVRHPAQLVSRALDVSASSIAYASGIVHVAGAQLLAFDEATLSPVKALTLISNVPIDRMRVEGGCTVLAGRTFTPELHPTTGTPTALALPGIVRSLATSAGRLYFLTDTSIEVWSSTPATPPSRRRPVK